MNTLLDKENRLFQTTAKTTDTESFQITFLDYFSFLTNEGADLIAHLAKESKPLLDEHKALEAQFTAIKTKVAGETKKLEKIAQKLKLVDDPQIKEGLHCLNTFLNGQFYAEDRFGGRDMDLADAVRKLYELGHEAEAGTFLTIKLESDKSIRVDNLSAFQGKKDYFAQVELYKKKCKTTIAGTYLRLVGLYTALIEVYKNDLDRDNIALANINDPYEHVAVARMSTVNLVSNIDLRQCLFDIERIHNEILSHNVQVQTAVSEQIFATKDGDIYHHSIGKLSYKLSGTKDPKFIRLFKNIIAYFPKGTNKMRIEEFNKLLPKHEQTGVDYRANLGKNADSFNNFLKKNAVENIHPKTKELLIHVTDEYITFRNYL